MGGYISVSARWALSGENFAEVRLHAQDTVWNLRQSLAKQVGEDGLLQVFFKDAALLDCSTLEEVGMEDGCTVFVVRLPPRLVVTASDDNTTCLWNAETGNCVNTLRGHKDSVHCANFSLDGKLVITASSDHTAKLWCTENGSLVRTLAGHSNTLRCAVFAPQRAEVYFAWTSSDDRTARLWRLNDGQCICTLTGHEGSVRSLAVSQNGDLVATASRDQTFMLWNLEVDEDIHRATHLFTCHGHRGAVTCVTFSPCELKLLSACSDGALRLWCVSSGTRLWVREVHHEFVCSAMFSPDGCYIVTASFDCTARIWNSSDGIMLRKLSGHGDWVFSARFSPDGQYIITASADYSASGLMLN